jgi:hypothetical protein
VTILQVFSEGVEAFLYHDEQVLLPELQVQDNIDLFLKHPNAQDWNEQEEALMEELDTGIQEIDSE